ncbi:MAG: hypothetical protein NW207_05925 [Cytophagales bacterium]|nr:hypothetical protein [Cytophagales bacterium]
MKTSVLKLVPYVIACILIVTSCKKRETDEVTPATTTIAAESEEVQVTNVNDNNETSGSIDQALDDVNSDLGSLSGARIEDTYQDCGRTVTIERANNSTVKGENLKTVKISYSGDCNALGKTRTGTIIVTLTKGKYFTEKGAEYTVSFSGYSTAEKGKTGLDTVKATLDGLQTVVNETGGYVWQVGRRGKTNPVIHKTSGDMKITFHNGKTRSWTVTRKVTYARPDTASRTITITVEGFGTDGANSDVVISGTNRFGDKFVTRISKPIIGYSTCFWVPAEGERIHTVTPASGGDPIVTTETINKGSGAASCPSGYKIKFKNRKGEEKSREVKWSK